MIGVVESERHEGDKVSIERRYFISSLATDAENFMTSVLVLLNFNLDHYSRSAS